MSSQHRALLQKGQKFKGGILFLPESFGIKPNLADTTVAFKEKGLIKPARRCVGLSPQHTAWLVLVRHRWA